VAPQQGAIFSSFPAISRAGLFYQSMGADRYMLRWRHDDKNEVLSFSGHAFRPRVAPDGQSIDFELVTDRTSAMMRFDPSTRTAAPPTAPVPAAMDASVKSPDGKWIAFEDAQRGSTQIWVRDFSTGTTRRLTGGNCNSFAPAWDLDSKSIVFASDCGRAFGLPALYRAPIAQ
jgi:Tol biopolymer transport system component